IIVDRLVREFKVEAYVGRPQVSYRETVSRGADAEGKFIRQSGGRGQYGHVVLHVEPASGRGIVFEDHTMGGSVPREFVPAGDRRRGAARDDVRLLDGRPLHDAGPRDVHDAVFAVRAGAHPCYRVHRGTHALAHAMNACASAHAKEPDPWPKKNSSGTSRT